MYKQLQEKGRRLSMFSGSQTVECDSQRVGNWFLGVAIGNLCFLYCIENVTEDANKPVQRNALLEQGGSICQL
jgi:hypothetical protein